jgi:hypothetical protein
MENWSNEAKVLVRDLIIGAVMVFTTTTGSAVLLGFILAQYREGPFTPSWTLIWADTLMCLIIWGLGVYWAKRAVPNGMIVIGGFIFLMIILGNAFMSVGSHFAPFSWSVAVPVSIIILSLGTGWVLLPKTTKK